MCMYESVAMTAVAQRGKRCQMSLDLEMVLSLLMWVPGTEHRSLWKNGVCS